MPTFQKLWAELEKLRTLLDHANKQAPALTRSVHAELRVGAANFIDYLALRQVDLRPLQFELERRGLSSLGRMEGHVRDALSQVRSRAWDSLRCEEQGAALGEGEELAAVDAGTSCEVSEQVLHRHTQALLGPRPQGRHIYVMVTAPSAAEVNDAWVGRLLDAGMNVLRVNGAHEGSAQWQHVVETARRVAAERSAALRVLVDLPGPKLRTVAVMPGRRVVRWKPERDALGRVTKPCQVALAPDDAATSSDAGPSLSVPREIFMTLVPGDELVLRDARGRSRHLLVAVLPSRLLVGNLRRTAYIVPETSVEHRRAGEALTQFAAKNVPEQPSRLLLALGDRLRLEPLPVEPDALTSELPVIGCSWAEALAAIEPGARVIFDDGKIDCVAESRSARGVVLRVTRVPEGGAKLGAEKGINLPDTVLPGLAFTQEDEQALAFAKSFADMVGLSFIQSRESVLALYRRLEDAKPELGVVLKIETAAAFADLPSILLAAMTRYPIGVMIARGDLAIEVGFQRLAEVQEELLWLCEAAQLPVIWATEVLAQLAKSGLATRAEVTDAAMSVRAECVMLNKGSKIELAVATLVDILRRMEHHQYKKRSLYRKLSLVLPSSDPAPAQPALDPRRQGQGLTSVVASR